ncbi:MAG: M1 family metallopeptidase [Myxococcales bacterium]
MRVLIVLCCALLFACGKPANLTPPIYAPLPAPDADAEGAPTTRLPVDTHPLRYQITLDMVPSRPIYRGKVAIDIALDRPRETIWLHQKGIRASLVRLVRVGVDPLPGTLESVSPSGLTALRLPTPVGPGVARIEIEFEADVGKRLSGLYRAEAAGVPYLFTQFEPIAAREAFPCFDEPRFKTPFEVTLRVEPSHVAVANTLEVSSSTGADGLREVHFAPTERLPTYLVAFAAGPFDVVNAPAIPASAVRPTPLPLRGVAVRGRGGELAYALAETKPLLEALEKYFGIAYPYDKLDLIAVPDFSAGAMENAGAITFRDTILLIASDATENQRRLLAYVNAHELAHQWFGNLVTMPWWDDIWLNEAFATWMGNRVVDEVYPQYRAPLGALASAQHAMDVDSQVAARQIRQPISSDDQISSAFDSITYAKGGAVLSMFERYLGPEVFRAGLRLYMQRHRFGNATASDLVQALTDASEKSELKSAFFSFLEQPGVPLVTATLQCGAAQPKLSLSQARYLPLGSTASPAQRWELPVCVRYQVGAELREQCVLLKDAELTTPLEATTCPAWVMPNAGAQGYYRWSLSAGDVKSLLAAVPQLTLAEQVSFASNVLAAMQAGALPADQGLAALSSLASSSERPVLEAVLSALSTVEHELLDEKTLPAYRAKLIVLLGPAYRELGLFATDGGSDVELGLKRALVVRALALSARDPAVSAPLAKFGRAELGVTPAPPGTLPTDLRDEALTAALREDPKKLLEPAIARLLASEDSQERSRLMSAIAGLDDPAYTPRVLDLSLDPRLRTNERLAPLYGQAGQVRTHAKALDWLTAHFDAFVAQLNSNAKPHVFGVLANACQAADIEREAAFLEPRAASIPGAPHEFALALESAKLCEAFRSRQADSARQFFGLGH